MKNILRLFVLLFPVLPGWSQEVEIPLWASGVVNQIETTEKEVHETDRILWITKVQTPSISIYLPAKPHATGQAVMICPGGGYGGLAFDKEGTDIAKWLNSKGIAGIVLKYRLPSSSWQQTPRLAPLQDAKQAIRLIRKNAPSWNIDPDKIGVMGFSAGGHLASTLGTHFNDSQADVDNEVASVSARPDFMILVYPVISMVDEVTHKGSRSNLLGQSVTEEMKNKYSNELQVNGATPPTFLVHSADDKSVPVENSILFYQALQKHKVSSEMHLYPHGGHGYSLALDKGHLRNWPETLAQWLASLN